jgi:hypothetical protein
LAEEFMDGFEAKAQELAQEPKVVAVANLRFPKFVR